MSNANPFTPPATAPLTRHPLPVRTFARHFGVAGTISAIPLLPLARGALLLSELDAMNSPSGPTRRSLDGLLIDANPWLALLFGALAVGALATGVALALASVRRELTGSADGRVQSGTLHGGLSALVTATLAGATLSLLIHPLGWIAPLPTATLGAALGLFFASWIAVPMGLIAGFGAAAELGRGPR